MYIVLHHILVSTDCDEQDTDGDVEDQESEGSDNGEEEQATEEQVNG